MENSLEYSNKQFEKVHEVSIVANISTRVVGGKKDVDI